MSSAFKEGGVVNEKKMSKLFNRARFTSECFLIAYFIFQATNTVIKYGEKDVVKG